MQHAIRDFCVAGLCEQLLVLVKNADYSPSPMTSIIRDYDTAVLVHDGLYDPNPGNQTNMKTSVL